MNVLITGCSKGLGRSLAERYISNGHTVYDIGRTVPEDLDVKHINADLGDHFDLSCKVTDIKVNFDVVILNAGILGGLRPQKDVSTQQLKQILDINVFSQKIILDHLIKEVNLKKVICISSGAANKCRYGWGNYAMSKSALKMLLMIYSVENPDIEFLSIAPGLIDTDMQSEVYGTDVDVVPNIADFRKKKDEGQIESPAEVSKKIIDVIDTSKRFPSGSFVDLRDL